MKKYMVSILTLVLACQGKSIDVTKYSPDDIQVLSRTQTINELPGADLFIKKFVLSAEEQKLIGEWIIFPSEMMQEKSDTRPNAIAFLPNRVFILWKSTHEKTSDRFGSEFVERYLLGHWKMESNTVKVLFLNQEIIVGVGHEPNFRRKPVNQTEYCSMEELKMDSKYPLQLEPFTFENFPEEIKKDLGLSTKDKIRYRNPVPLSFDGGYQDLFAADKPWSSFLLNLDIADEKSAQKLIKMYTTGSIMEERYDLEKDEYDLGFGTTAPQK